MKTGSPRPSSPAVAWPAVALLTLLWVGTIAVVVRWWEPAGPRYEATARVRGLPAAARADPGWLPQTRRALTSNRSLLHAAEAIAGREKLPTSVELAAFRDALELGVTTDPVSSSGALVCRYVGDLPQGPALVEALARRFAASQPSAQRSQVRLAPGPTARGGVRGWAVGLLVVLAVCTGGWCLAWWGRIDRPLASARQAQAVLNLPVLAVEWRA